MAGMHRPAIDAGLPQGKGQRPKTAKMLADVLEIVEKIKATGWWKNSPG
jgi:hypothetical protein